MSTFVSVPAAAIRERLAAAGFRLTSGSPREEEVYERPHDKDDRYVVQVYTSILRGAEEARDCGADAIRVVALVKDGKFHYPPKVVPIFKANRIHRTGSVDKVLDRMIERARQAYKACNQHRMVSVGA
jgi:hypothetical protein